MPRVAKGPPLLIAAVLSSALAAPAAAGQELIPEEPTCATCSIVVERLARLGAGPGSAPLPGGVFAASMDARGRYWIVLSEEPIMVFDEGGGFVSTVGRMGGGPGELRHPSRIAMGQSEAIVFDDVRATATVFDLDFEHVRTVSFMRRRLWGVAVFDGPDSVLANGLFALPGEVRLPFTVVDLTSNPAAVIRSFGPDLEDRSSRVGLYRLQHVLAVPERGTFWCAETQRYHLSRWSSEGELLDSLMRQPEWFSGFSNGTLGGPEMAPHPSIAAIAQDSAGRLWVFLRVARPGWRETWAQWVAEHGPLPRNGEVSGDALPRPWDLITTMVEVLDPRTRRVVHRQTLDAFVINVLTGPRVFAYTEPEPEFEPVVDVLSLRLDEGR